MGKTKIHQVLAVLPDAKNQAIRRMEVLDRLNYDMVTGIIRKYQPLDETGDKLPPEFKPVPVSMPDLLKELRGYVEKYYDEYLTLETGNQGANADVVVDDTVILERVPATVLIMLKQQLENLRTMIGRLPILPADKEWEWDANKNLWCTKPIETMRTQKTVKPVVLYEATDKHPAQVEKVNVDQPVGTWTTYHLCSALPAQVQKEAMDRVQKLMDAVQVAHAKANSTEVDKQHMGRAIFRYVFGDLTD